MEKTASHPDFADLVLGGICATPLKTFHYYPRCFDSPFECSIRGKLASKGLTQSAEMWKSSHKCEMGHLPVGSLVSLTHWIKWMTNGLLQSQDSVISVPGQLEDMLGIRFLEMFLQFSYWLPLAYFFAMEWTLCHIRMGINVTKVDIPYTLDRCSFTPACFSEDALRQLLLRNGVD